jgi:ABC-type transport system involved in multi-copper enzyme maturation permease subunit
MFGTVVRLELLLGSRRGRFDALRRFYAGWLVLQFGFFFCAYLSDLWTSVQPPPRGLGHLDYDAADRFCSSYLEAFIFQQFVLLLLLTPAFVAGAITDDKSRGTLLALLTTHLTSAEIILGKLVGRLSQIGTLALAGLPLLCLVGPFGEFDFFTFLALVAYMLLVAFALGSASLLASVWCRQTRSAVLGVYTAGAAGLLLAWSVQKLTAWLGRSAPPALIALAELATDGLEYLDPLYILEPAWAADQHLPELARRLLMALVLWGGLAVGCLTVAVWRLRPAYTRQLESVPRAGVFARRSGARPVDDDEPIRWKERTVEGIAPLPVLRCVPRWFTLLTIFLGTSWFSLAHLAYSNVTLENTFALVSEGNFRLLWATRPHLLTLVGFLQQSMVVLVLATLVVGIRCSGAVSGEREKQTWEALLLTPLPVRELIHGKLRGVVGATWPYLIAYAVPALGFAVLGGPMVLCITLVGLVVCVPIMRFMGAAGLYFSVRLSSSWKSLLATLGTGYFGSLLVGFITLPVLSCVVMLVFFLFSSPFARLPAELMEVVLVCVTAVAWYFILAEVARRFLVNAQNRIIGRERTPYWKAGENCSWFVEQYLGQYENKHA